ncbi:Accessory secretory protein Asp3 [Streptococcus sp. DD11]|uniref:accessory Sec system protein Asp3 n=1 Tax=Streptococcus sp. DD11 TaxID=1777879 RepID=UPI000799A245|nr:accessory Sec system protein Asp3 [Streptococcus sp. DD11]KXT79301.1 Accessory secretory protein Asp3 [Streptococcus sp. DD11]
MKVHKRKGIYWGELRGLSAAGNAKDFTYLYGSTLIYHSPSHIFFENKLMASGQTIHEWSSGWHYQRDRLQPSLPLLKRGARYRLTRDMDLYPDFSVFLKVIFFDRYNEELGNQVERSESLTFTYPQDAYSYKVQLLSAGVESFEFYALKIDQVEEEFDD